MRTQAISKILTSPSSNVKTCFTIWSTINVPSNARTLVNIHRYSVAIVLEAFRVHAGIHHFHWRGQ